jgi:aspartyl-tRNA(Asn)/glutamyl-tRNA(Gln) amidotransferase subunit C
MVTKEEVKHLGWLSRIDLSEEEIERYTAQIEQIVAYLDKLDSMPLEKAEAIKTTVDLSGLRDDSAEAFGSDPIGTKSRKDGFVKGPRMV